MGAETLRRQRRLLPSPPLSAFGRAFVSLGDRRSAPSKSSTRGDFDTTERGRVMNRLIGWCGLAALAWSTCGSAQEFCNTMPIVIPGAGTSGPASPYPGTIVVSGGPASIAAVVVSVHGFSHTFPDDVDMLLIAPGGQTLLMQSDAGSSADAVTVRYAVSDTAPVPIPDGTVILPTYYRPANFGSGDTFPAPAPPGP